MFVERGKQVLGCFSRGRLGTTTSERRGLGVLARWIKSKSFAPEGESEGGQQDGLKACYPNVT